jgi:hypothetical protein
VQATHLTANTYRVEGPIPDDEEWAFAPGSVVHCESRSFSDGEGLTAITLAG